MTPRVVDAAAARAGGAEAADTVGAGGVVLDVVIDATGAVGGELREIIRALGAGLVAEEVVDIENGGIFQLLLRDDRDGGTEVFELRVDARAGKRVEGLTALIVLDDGEGERKMVSSDLSEAAETVVVFVGGAL